MSRTIHHFEVKRFCDRYIDLGEGDLVDALHHMRAETGIATQHLLWLYSGKVHTVTR